MSPKAERAFERLKALIELSPKTGVISNRTQISILRALSPSELTEVAMGFHVLGEANPLKKLPTYDALSGVSI